MVLEPISPSSLREALNNGTIQFAFKKKDGNLRIALGTTNMELVPLDDHPKGTGTSSPKVVPYFDLNKQAWRSVSAVEPIYLPE